MKRSLLLRLLTGLNHCIRLILVNNFLVVWNFGEHVKEYVAKLTHDGVWALYHDFVHVLQTNDAVHCRSLLQKLRPSGEDGPNKARQMEQWNINDAEYIIRLSEAGFKPQSFRPL